VGLLAICTPALLTVRWHERPRRWRCKHPTQSISQVRQVPCTCDPVAMHRRGGLTVPTPLLLGLLTYVISDSYTYSVEKPASSPTHSGRTRWPMHGEKITRSFRAELSHWTRLLPRRAQRALGYQRTLGRESQADVAHAAANPSASLS
jgi:hypothetical protein